jgi:hypothetical protein
MKNTKSIGEVSEAMVIARLLSLGFSVSIPFGNNQRYDIIFDDGKWLKKGQIKTGKLKKGCVRFNTSSVNGFTKKRSGYKGQVDYFLVYCPDTEKVYKVPEIEVGTGGVYLRVSLPNKNAPTGRIKWAKDFEI